MEKTLSRIRNLRARRKLSLPASPSPGFVRNDARSGSEDDLVEWSVRIRSLIPDLQSKSDENGGNHEVKKSNSERRKVVQWDPNVPKFPGRAQSEKSSRKKRSGSVSVIANTKSRDEKFCDNNNVSIPIPNYPSYPYPRHGSLPHVWRRNGNHRQNLGKLLVPTLSHL